MESLQPDRPAEGGGDRSVSTDGDFVSHRSHEGTNVEASLGGPPDLAPPGLGDAATRWILLLAVLLQAWAWHRLSGYQLGDSVEYMDRAFAVARGETLDTRGAVRSFGFSTLLLPFFATAKAIGLEEMRWTVHAVRVFQMLLGLGLVFACMRVGWRVGGRRVGWWSGVFVATNPVFLQYSVDPVSGIAAAFFTALALNVLIERRAVAACLGGGLLLGAAFMMAYQTLLVAVPLLGFVLLRDRWAARGTWLAAGLGLALAVCGQVALDKLTYGTWGLSVTTYVVENSGGVLFTFLAFIGLGETEWVRELYGEFIGTMSPDATVAAENRVRGNLQSPFFYLANLPQMLVWRALLCGGRGVARRFARRSWKSLVLLAVLALNIAVMSHKGSKSFRLWLPLLPLIAPLCAYGLAWLGGFDRLRPGLWRRGSIVVIALASILLGLFTLDALNTRRYGAYWDAIEVVNGQAALQRARAEAAGEPFEPVVVGSAYNWAVFCRDSADVRVVKFQQHLYQWRELGPELRAVVLAQLRELDWLIAHGTVFDLEPDLTAAINAEFEVVASYWDEDTDPALSDVRVLRRLRGGPASEARAPLRLFEVVDAVDPGVYRDEWELDEGLLVPQHFTGTGANGSEESLTLLGFEIAPLPGSGFQWITYHWFTATGLTRDYVLVDRITSQKCPWAWQNNRVPGHGALPTSTWSAGQVVREGYLLHPGQSPFDPEAFQPLGGSFRRGQVMPAMLWVIGHSPPPEIHAHLLRPLSGPGGEPLQTGSGVVALEESGLRTPSGHILSPDGLVRVARFLLPIAPRYRWPDDGSPGPDDAELARAQVRQSELLEEQRLQLERQAAQEAAESVLRDASGGSSDASSEE